MEKRSLVEPLASECLYQSTEPGGAVGEGGAESPWTVPHASAPGSVTFGKGCLEKPSQGAPSATPGDPV